MNDGRKKIWPSTPKICRGDVCIGDTQILTKEQVAFCIEMGIERNRKNNLTGRIDTNKYSHRRSIDIDIQGCLGEYAFCLLFNIEPTLKDTSCRSSSKEKTFDCSLPSGVTFDVKTVLKEGLPLLVTKKNHNNAPVWYALMEIKNCTPSQPLDEWTSEHTVVFRGIAHSQYLLLPDRLKIVHEPTFDFDVDLTNDLCVLNENMFFSDINGFIEDEKFKEIEKFLLDENIDQNVCTLVDGKVDLSTYYEDDLDIIALREEYNNLQKKHAKKITLVRLLESKGRDINHTLASDVSEIEKHMATVLETIQSTKEDKFSGKIDVKVNIVVEKGSFRNVAKKKPLLNAQKTKKKNNSNTEHYYQVLPDLLEGYLYNPVTFQLTIDLDDSSTPLPYGTLKEYSGHLYCTTSEHVKVILEQQRDRSNFLDESRTYLLLNIEWQYVHCINPLYPYVYTIEDRNFYGVPKTPSSEYTVKLPKEYQDKHINETSIRHHERIFTIYRPSDKEYILMHIGPIDDLDNFKVFITQSGKEDYVKTTQDEPFECITEKDVKIKKVSIHVLKEQVLSLRQYFESAGYIVMDDYIRHQGLTVFFEQKDKLYEKANAYVKNCQEKGMTEIEIVGSCLYPLKTYVIHTLRDSCSKIYNTSFVQRNQQYLYDRGPSCSDGQIEQLLDAYYWTYLAPEERRINFQSLINFFLERGRIVRLKFPYQASGKDVGRSVSKTGGSLRFHDSKMTGKQSSTTIPHSVLPSKYVMIDSTGNVVPKKIHPRKKVANKKPPKVHPSILKYTKPKERKENINQVIKLPAGKYTFQSKSSTAIPVVDEFLTESIKISNSAKK